MRAVHWLTLGIVVILGLGGYYLLNQQPTEQPDTPTPTTASPIPSGAVTATQADNSRVIDLKQGQTLALTLESNLSTGYSWNLISPTDTKVLAKTSNEYIEAKHVDGLTGVSGKEIWQFRATSAGTATLRLAYAHPWEIAKSTDDEFTLTVRVK